MSRKACDLRKEAQFVVDELPLLGVLGSVDHEEPEEHCQGVLLLSSAAVLADVQGAAPRTAHRVDAAWRVKDSIYF